ncbi:MAG: sigma-70 family RNA polymerase sigma factor [Oscillospiraceae bacterium]|nr:sigma-70 family RNA polymerase sigma factor [Oscillospiraceae bacterium]
MTRYFVSFKDGQGIRREVEISPEVYEAFAQFVKTERNLRRWDERHREYSELTDETLNNRAKRSPKSLEETAIDNERSEVLRQAIAELPEIQRRRFVLYFEYGMTCAAIGRMEGCSGASVKGSVDRAKAKVIEKLKV